MNASAGGSISVGAVIPSLNRSIEQLDRLTADLRDVPSRPVVVATGKKLTEELSISTIEHVSPRNNPGFGKSIGLGVQCLGDVEWLLLVNDDVTFDPGDLRTVLGEVMATAADGRPTLAFLENEAPRPIPGKLATWRNLALVPSVRRAKAPGGATYKSFSLVAVNRAAWDLLDGFDDSIVYTFEDADFARRARSRGVAVLDAPVASLNHVGGGTSRRLIADVLPVSAHSATRYLIGGGVRPGLARTLVVSALAARTVPSLARPNRSAHLRGIARGISHVARGEVPSLPGWKDC